MECKNCHSRWETGESVSKLSGVCPSLSGLMPGQGNVNFGKYLWRVLDVQNGRALLLAEEILEKLQYSERKSSERRSITWETCELRNYLNGAFLQTFSSREQEQIAQIENVNADNQWYGTSGGRNTVDKVFLLSIDEVIKYFGDSGDLQARKGWYYEEWLDKEDYVLKDEYVLKDGKGWSINDQYNSARMAKYEGKWESWWLRSPGHSSNCAANVSFDGGLLLVGNSGGLKIGVRPALWLNL